MLQKFLFFALGLGLFAYVLGQIDLNEVLHQTLGIGWGIAIVLALHLTSFVADTLAWHITLRPAPLTAIWLYRIWKVRMVGAAFNQLIPAAGFGGEPLKAILLRRHYGIKYRDGIASLILSQTILAIGLVMFLTIGFALMLHSRVLPDTYNLVAGASLMALTVIAAILVTVQLLRPTAMAGRWLDWSSLGDRLMKALQSIREVENELVVFYTRHRRRFAGAVAVSLIPWLIGVPEIYFTALFLGEPVSLTEAWIIEAAVQLVRSAAFFLPSALGVQEGVFLLLVSAITGSPTQGIAMAMVRRFRDILWIAWGMLVGLNFSLAPARQNHLPDKPAS